LTNSIDFSLCKLKARVSTKDEISYGRLRSYIFKQINSYVYYILIVILNYLLSEISKDLNVAGWK